MLSQVRMSTSLANFQLQRTEFHRFLANDLNQVIGCPALAGTQEYGRSLLRNPGFGIQGFCLFAKPLRRQVIFLKIHSRLPHLIPRGLWACQPFSGASQKDVW